jgi:hypothetical protein
MLLSLMFCFVLVSKCLLQTLAFFLRHPYWKSSEKIIGILLTALWVWMQYSIFSMSLFRYYHVYAGQFVWPASWYCVAHESVLHSQKCVLTLSFSLKMAEKLVKKLCKKWLPDIPCNFSISFIWHVISNLEEYGMSMTPRSLAILVQSSKPH